MVVVWARNARANMKNQREWYKLERGAAAESKFVAGILSDVNLIMQNPQMGKLEERLNEISGQQKWRSILSGRKFRIIYCVEGEVLQIFAVWACVRSQNLLSRIIKNEKIR